MTRLFLSDERERVGPPSESWLDLPKGRIRDEGAEEGSELECVARAPGGGVVSARLDGRHQRALGQAFEDDRVDLS